MQKIKDSEKMKIFGLQAFRKHKEVIPLVAIISVATLGCIGFSMYTMTKPDVQCSRKDKIPSWMRYMRRQDTKALHNGQKLEA
ncbi:normal mucosa of esophagus-specific gene 1 protein-like [Rhipicephalus sanguineus]|uniref:normal mucosa of esophagus-specific gene 1 protein-like n=1 Tax=Rhipicephalus sanguineus TaxID=34632 RepID=UPI0018944F04|nr:normal mucosa of esophagus-specific gene 1 protein-like [Rhipicephalus sanguineus]